MYYYSSTIVLYFEKILKTVITDEYTLFWRLTSVSPLNVHQVKLTLGMQNQAQGQRSRQREWRCCSHYLSSQWVCEWVFILFYFLFLHFLWIRWGAYCTLAKPSCHFSVLIDLQQIKDYVFIFFRAFVLLFFVILVNLQNLCFSYFLTQRLKTRKSENHWKNWKSSEWTVKMFLQVSK